MAPPDNESFAALFEQASPEQRGRRNRFGRGERLEVVVVAIGRDAVFADLGGKQEGVFDRHELLDEEGKLSVDVGARISAIVKQVDKTGVVSLTPVFVRAATDDPSGEDGEIVIPKDRSTPLLVEGARLRGKVTGIERYGIFVQLDGTTGRGGRGLVPNAETNTPRGADLRKHFQKDQEIEVKVLEIAEDGKIRLSIKALDEDAERKDAEAFKKSRRKEQGGGGGPRNFGTLGDLMKKRGL